MKSETTENNTRLTTRGTTLSLDPRKKNPTMETGSTTVVERQVNKVYNYRLALYLEYTPSSKSITKEGEIKGLF